MEVFGPKQADAFGNPLKYALQQAYRLVSCLGLERVIGIFIAKGSDGVHGKQDVAFPSLPIQHWSTLPYIPTNELWGYYLGTSIEPPAAHIDHIPPSAPPPDFTLPVVGSNFGVPYYQSDLDVPVTMSATDNVAVYGYLITYTDTTPNPNDGFYPDPYTRFPLDPDKATSKIFIEAPDIWKYSYTLYGWASDTSGNVSLYRSTSFEVQGKVPFDTPAALVPPPTPRIPTVDVFTLETTTPNTLTVAVDTFGGSSFVSITGYALTVDNSQAPLWNDTIWELNVPQFVIFPNAGTHTVYAWVKDRINQVSAYKSIDVNITLGPVPTFSLSELQFGSKTDPYPRQYNEVYVYNDGLSCVNQIGSIDYLNGSWLQATNTWNKGRSSRSVYAAPTSGSTLDAIHRSYTEYMSNFAFYRYSQFVIANYSQNPGMYAIPIDAGRYIVMGAYKETFTKLGIPQIYYTGSNGQYHNGIALFDSAPEVNPVGLPSYDGITFYCEGASGTYVGGDKFIYTVLITAETYMAGWTDMYSGDNDPSEYTPNYFIIKEQRANGIQPSIPIVSASSISFSSDSLVEEVPLAIRVDSNNHEVFMNGKSSTIANFVSSRGCIPTIASTIHTSNHGRYLVNCGDNDCQYPTLHGDVYHVSEFRHKTKGGKKYPLTLNRSVSTPMQWQIVFEGTVSAASGLIVQSGIKACWPISSNMGWINLEGSPGVSCSHPTITGNANHYAVQVIIKGYLGNNILWGVSSGKDTSYGGGLVNGRQNTSAGDTGVWSPDLGSTWYRIAPPTGRTDNELGSMQVFPLGGYGLGLTNISGKMYIFNNGVLTPLIVRGYDHSGKEINITSATNTLSYASPGSVSWGQALLWQQDAAGTTQDTWLYVATSTTTIHTHGPYISTVDSITCMTPGYKDTWTPGTVSITGDAHNEITFTNPLPGLHSVVTVVATIDGSKSKRLLLLSNWGTEVYDVGYFNDSINVFNLIGCTFSGGAWGDFQGDAAIPGYVPPTILPLSITSSEQLRTIISSVQEYVSISVEGGIFPYSFSVVNGTLPVGMSLDTIGTIEGICTTPDTYSFTIKVTDMPGTIVEKTFTLKVV